MQNLLPAPVSSGELDDLLEDVLNDDIVEFNLLEEARGLLGVEDEGMGSPVQRCLEAAVEQECSTAPRRGRSVNTHSYPGNLYEFTLQYASPAKGVAEHALWCRLAPDAEDSRYNTHFRMPKRAFEDLCQRLRCHGPEGPEDTAFLFRKDSTEACVPGHQSYSFRRVLALTLYFLAHSSTSTELSVVFGIPVSTAWTLVGDGVTALVRVLLHGVGGNTPVVRFPQTDEEKLTVIGGFESLIGHLPWCLGAIDGTHIGQRKPDVTRCPMGRDLYWSWKSKTSQLLVWIVDARGRALYVSTGHPGCSSDAGVRSRDPLRLQCEDGLLHTPVQRLGFSVGGTEHTLELGPYFVGDGAFQLKPYMMKCYPEDDTHAKRVFNQAVCDVRKVVEQAIGRLKMCWQFCHKNVWHGDADFVRSCIEACVGLHNFRMQYTGDCDAEIVRQWIADQEEELAEQGGEVAEQDEQDEEPAPDSVEGEHIQSFLAAYLVHQDVN